jgi:hypothetical protein
MTELISDIHEAVDMIVRRMTEKSGLLGIEFVGAYNEKRIPKYPAVVVTPGDKEKEPHAMQTFAVSLQCQLYVYHANLTLNKRERSREDLLLVSKIEKELESDYGWQIDPNDPQTKRLIFGYVASIEPGNIQPRGNKSDLIIGTRMVWRGLSQRRLVIE